MDSVLLPAAVPAMNGEHVLDLGCGAGVASLCLCCRVSGVRATGLELQSAYARIARRNARINQVEFNVVDGNVLQPPERIAACRFNHVLANPPYHREGTAVPPSDEGRAASVIEQVPLSAWTELGLAVLVEGGWLTMVLPASRQQEILSTLHGFIGRLMLRPVVPLPGRPANRILLRYQKGGRRGLTVVPPLILHETGGSSFTAEAEGVLRHGDPVEFRA